MRFSRERPFVIVGAGKMGGAMLAGWLSRGIDAASLLVVDPNPSDDLKAFLAQHGIVHAPVVPAGTRAALVLIAVKPQIMGSVLPGLAPAVAPDTLVLSVAAGTPVRAFEAAFGPVPVIRAMPNTPAMVGRGVTALFPTPAVSDPDRAMVAELLSAVGSVEWLTSEDQIDLVTAVSGSGPAYVFLMAECLAEAGRKAGLPADLAARLAEATVSGAGELLFRSDDTPAVLRQNVTSPNGTTAAALSVLMAPDGLQPLMDAAVSAAAQRARELAG
ncbi:pyrroline-5-carboxylate reductase [Pannonibacter tanglangensis]|uniref:Pyrroline-5-carboxylate reductase n=1 Tax=Pannonibacter tanglangensis TaxID=2750084 RepID=A0ABW9ZF25_9HYPH|nr:pyrroline-5-carboxylate reductase [Pannonibacter sp. XCT-34]NBN63273.1 pyrroline-5-carboxylate reductase [Pannonibacter sp. XCT-34]